MSNLSRGSSSSVPGFWRRRRGDSERGIPKHCRCGEKAVIKTSGTARNPGKLFYCCPYGSEEDKFHLFTWTDERIVEEVEDLKISASDLKDQMSDLRAKLAFLENHLKPKHPINEASQAQGGCCSIL